MSRLRKIGNESKKLQIANRDMEKRLNEIKALFEKEQGEFILSLSSDNINYIILCNNKMF